MGSEGKLTDDGYASCSLLPRIKNKDVTTLDNCIRARKGESVRNDGNRFTAIGNVLEEPLIIHGANLLGLENLESDVKQRFNHATLPLQASLDARATANNLVIEQNIELGIYTPSTTKLVLDGKGVIENKVTRDFAEDMLPEWRGKLQMQGQLEVMGDDYTWGAVFVLYNSTDFRIFVYKKDPGFAKELEEMILDFDRRIIEEDYYPPKVSTDVHKIFKDPNVDDVADIDEKTEEIIADYVSAKELEKNAKKVVDDLNLKLMMALGNYTKARSDKFEISLPTINRKATPKKVVEAKPAQTIRGKTVRVKRRATP